MRALILTALAVLAALPAFAQADAEPTGGGEDAVEEARIVRWVVHRDTTLDDDGAVEVRLDSLGARLGGIFGPDGPIGGRMRRFEIRVDGDAPSVRFQTDDDGVDPTTHARARRLERDARRLADAQRDAPSRDTERELDAALAELFELRGDIRRQRAAALRARAEVLQDEASALDGEAERREADRDRIIEARKRELLDDGTAADW